MCLTAFPVITMEEPPASSRINKMRFYRLQNYTKIMFTY